MSEMQSKYRISKDNPVNNFLSIRQDSSKTIAKNLANAHWDYIYELLMKHEVNDDVIDIIEFHYITAFEHGFRHGVEAASTGRVKWDGK